MIAGFLELERIEGQYGDLIGEIPDDYPERVAIEDSANQAKSLREEGEFEAAAKILTGAIEDIKKTVETLKQAAVDLRKKAKPVVVDAAPSEVDEIDRLHREMMEAVAGKLPSKAGMTTAGRRAANWTWRKNGSRSMSRGAIRRARISKRL